MKQLQLLTLFALFAFSASAQNVGIGTPTPSDQLHTTGTVRFEKYRGPSARMMQIDSSGRLVVSAAGAVASNTTAYAVADNGCAAGTGITSAIIISGQPTAVPSSKIAVRINMTHTFDGDLKIFLIPPGGGSVLALADNAGSSGDNFTNTIFTDQALISVMAGTAPFTGQYRPSGNTTGCLLTGTVLTNFAAIGAGNIVPNGTWTLRIFDNAAGDVGTLNNWSISFTGPESITTADENNYIPKFSAGNLVASSMSQPAGSINIGIGLTNPVASLQVSRGAAAGGTAQFDGTQNSSSFNIGVPENTVIRGGKTASEVIINDIGTGNVRIADVGGNVGIGIGIPTAKLHVNGAIKITNGSQGLGKVLTSDAAGLASWSPLPVTSSYWAASGADIYNSNAGNVGIGNTNPRAPLSFASALGNKIALWGNADGAHYGIGVAGGGLQLYADGPGSDVLFGHGSSSSFTEKMRVKGNGNVGIGTNNPTATLDVVRGTGTNGTARFYGTAYASHFNYAVGEETYIRGGLATSEVLINDQGTGNVRIADLGGNVGIGIPQPGSPTLKLDVNGRMRIRHLGETAGLWFNKSTNLNNEGSFIGLRNDQQFGVFGDGSWKFAIDNADGTMYVGSPNLDTENPALGVGYKLRVYGKIISEEVRVQLKTAWPDYVFSKNYKLRSLSETEKYILENNHLPNMPAAAEVEKSGIALGEMQTKMMEKIEELTLYLIEANKKIMLLQDEMKDIKKRK